MASLGLDRPDLKAPTGDMDPFVSSSSTGTAPTHHRYSDFDQELFAAGPGSSPRQAKRALEAHIAETERRLDEAGKLGTALVAQRKLLAEQLQEVEQLQAEGEIQPELRQKLVDIEREFNDLSRESARAFLPKQRVPSNETNPGSPYVPEGRSGRRSVSPSKFESHATGSPTKLSVPNRKIRNQPSNRVHDIEFAAEISTSLISQVRNLQALLAEREEESRELQADKQRLEIDSETLQQRLKTLDESEHRYKEENWNLETRLQELNASHKEVSDKEKKLTQVLNVSKAEQAVAQRELEEVKSSHAKLLEDHAAAIKHHDIELGTAKRGAAASETQLLSMQKKIDELTNQNTELAKAFSVQRGRPTERDPTSGVSEDDFESANDNITPEHSPPPSPVKGTPRHSILETETMKTSLHHAQRTIQSQRSQLHREKTEKIELRRMLQEAREELERSRGDTTGASSSRRRKPESKEFKKPNLLGSFRASRNEVIMDDEDWEDNRDAPPRTLSVNANAATTDSSDHFDTANEASESAFETANERATETEDFQTTNEQLSDESDAMTETEGNSRGFGRMKRTPALPPTLTRAGNRNSFHSTASTSADEDETTVTDIRTPISRMSSQKFRNSRGGYSRNSRQLSEEPAFKDSPASFAGSQGDSPQAPGQSLFAELQDLGSDDDSLGPDTPSRRSVRSRTPASIRRTTSPPPAVPALPKLIMVDIGVMTDPVDFATLLPSIAEDDHDRTLEPLRPTSMQSAVLAPEGRSSWLSTGDLESSRPVSTMSYSDSGAQYDTDMEGKLAQFPVPPKSMSTPPMLSISEVQAEHVEPCEDLPPTPPALSLAPISVEHTEPIAEPEIPVPILSLSTLASHNLTPIAEPEAPVPSLSMTTLSSQIVEPIAEPQTTPPALSMSTITGHGVEPVPEPEPPAPVLPLLTLSTVMGEQVHPIAEPETETPRAIAPVELPKPEPQVLSMAALAVQHTEPVHQTEPTPPVLSLAGIRSEHSEPVAEPTPEPVVPLLAMSTIAAEHIRPIDEPALPIPSLTFSSVAAQGVEPIAPVVDELPIQTWGFTPISSIETLPLSPRSPRRDGIILPREQEAAPRTPREKLFGSVKPRGREGDESPIIAEDDTRLSPRDSASDTPDSQRPFKEISSNARAGSPRKPSFKTTDQGAQTSLTAGEIDDMLRSGRRGHSKKLSVNSVGSPETTGTVRIHRPESEGRGSPARQKGKMLDEVALEQIAKRPGSAASGRASFQDAPPLPQNHRQIIEAARTSSSGGPPSGSMGPPLWPASAMKHRPVTPNQRPMSSQSGRGTPTPRAARTGSTTGRVEVHSPTQRLARSRQSSVSSFASEIDARFGIRPNEMAMEGFGPNTDPRMIQAITQTMIGEYLWKYTRKTGRGEMSEKRHRRYFWMHPYTKTLYWSDKDPSAVGRSELKTRSVPIEAVRVVTDDNPMPPGLHRKSLVVISPGRTVKFTCTTGQRHETWFNALSYLLLRTNEGQLDAEDGNEHITREDVDEFNPQVGQSIPNGSRSRHAPSLSSYNSRSMRNDVPSDNMSLNIPTLTPSHAHNAPGRKSSGTFSKLSGRFKSGGAFGSFGRNRAPSGADLSIYEASEVHDSAEDLREMIERQDRESDRLENVRACCDGKHDVGSIPYASKRGRGHHTHSHPTPSSSTRAR